MSRIIKARDFCVDKIKTGNMKDTGNGGKTVYLNYEGEPLRVQTPWMVCPFGLTAWPKQEEGKEPMPTQKYSIEMAFKSMENDQKLQEFYDMISSLDQRMLHEGMAHSKEWFKKEHKSIDVTEAVYKPMIKNNPNNDYPPIFKANIPCDNGQPRCESYNMEREKLDITSTNVRGARLMAILQCTGIWLAGGNFGCTWKVLQLLVKPSATIDSFAFVMDKEDEDSMYDRSAYDANKNNNRNKSSANVESYMNTVADSEEDD